MPKETRFPPLKMEIVPTDDNAYEQLVASIARIQSGLSDIKLLLDYLHDAEVARERQRKGLTP